MPKRTIALLATTFALLIGPIAAFGQSPVSVAAYPYDVETATERISEHVSQGMIPIGIEVIEGERIWILYAGSGNETGPNFSIHQFSAPENLEGEMNQIIQRGWAPVGLSRTSSNLYGLFIQEEHSIASWRIHRSASDESSIQQSLTEFHSNGFSSAGVSVFQDYAWYLFVRGENQPQERVALRAVPEEEEAIRTQLTEATGAGWRPAGISQLSQGLALLFTQPVGSQ